jgi:hypothetical protein
VIPLTVWSLGREVWIGALLKSNKTDWALTFDCHEIIRKIKNIKQAFKIKLLLSTNE